MYSLSCCWCVDVRAALPHHHPQPHSVLCAKLPVTWAVHGCSSTNVTPLNTEMAAGPCESHSVVRDSAFQAPGNAVFGYVSLLTRRPPVPRITLAHPSKPRRREKLVVCGTLTRTLPDRPSSRSEGPWAAIKRSKWISRPVNRSRRSKRGAGRSKEMNYETYDSSEIPLLDHGWRGVASAPGRPANPDTWGRTRQIAGFGPRAQSTHTL